MYAQRVADGSVVKLRLFTVVELPLLLVTSQYVVLAERVVDRSGSRFQPVLTILLGD